MYVRILGARGQERRERKEGSVGGDVRRSDLGV